MTLVFALSLIVLGVIAAFAMIVWVRAGRMEVPYLDRDGFPQSSQRNERLKPSPEHRDMN
jgi:hypothetical protein